MVYTSRAYSVLIVAHSGRADRPGARSFEHCVPLGTRVPVTARAFPRDLVVLERICTVLDFHGQVRALRAYLHALV